MEKITLFADDNYILEWNGDKSTVIINMQNKLKRITSDQNQSELLSIAHGSIYSVLYYAAGTWLNLLMPFLSSYEIDPYLSMPSSQGCPMAKRVSDGTIDR